MIRTNLTLSPEAASRLRQQMEMRNRHSREELIPVIQFVNDIKGADGKSIPKSQNQYMLFFSPIANITNALRIQNVKYKIQFEVKFHQEYDEGCQYTLEYFDGIFYLLSDRGVDELDRILSSD